MKKQKLPICFGRVKHIFPKSHDGLRIVLNACIFCCLKIDCVRMVINNDEEFVIEKRITDMAYSSGFLSFFQRWSKIKSLNQLDNDK